MVTGAGLSARARLDLAAFSASDRPPPRRSTATVPSTARWAPPPCGRSPARYHRDLHDYLFQPVAGCFFGWDTARSHGRPHGRPCCWRPVPTAAWRTYRDGMDFLARRLATGTEVVTDRAVREVTDAGGHAVLRFDDGQVTARAAVLAVPAPVAAALRPDAPADEQPFLTSCTFTPMMKVSCLLDRPLAPAARRPVHILLTPAAEEDVLSGVVVDHAKDPGRAPAGRGLVTLVAGPRRVPSCWTPLPTRPPTSSSARRNAMSRASATPAATVSCTPSATACRKPHPRPCGNAPASCPGRRAPWSTPATGSCCGPPPREPSGRARWPRPAS